MMNPLQQHYRCKVLVTGARGFLGSHLCRRLVELGAHPHAVVREQPGPSSASLTWHVGDMAQLDVVRRLFRQEEPDVVFHLAGCANGAQGLDLVSPTFRDDLNTAVNVLTAATETGCNRVVVTGSLDEPLSESWAAVPASPYSAAKRATCLYAAMFHAVYGTPVVVVRPFMTYGPGQRVDKIVPYVITSLLKGQAPRLSSGRRRVDWVFVEDLVDGILTAGRSGPAEGQIVDLGAGRLVSVREVVEQLAGLIGAGIEPAWGALADRPGETENAADTDRAAQLIDWRAVTPLQQGLARTIDWYRANMTPEPGVTSGVFK